MRTETLFIENSSVFISGNQSSPVYMVLIGEMCIVLLNSGYIWNKTETKQFCFSFISVLFQM